MFIWWFIGSIGCLYVGIIYCQNNIPELADIEPPQDSDEQIGLSVDDIPPDLVANNENNLEVNEFVVTDTISTTIQTPEPFSCHECTNCTSKSDFTTRICKTGITMCYKMHKRINNISRIINRGCSTSKGQCTVHDDDQSNSFDSITCCTSHKCNQATQFKPLFFLSTLSLFTLMIIIINI